MPVLSLISVQQHSSSKENENLFRNKRLLQRSRTAKLELDSLQNPPPKIKNGILLREIGNFQKKVIPPLYKKVTNKSQPKVPSADANKNIEVINKTSSKVIPEINNNIPDKNIAEANNRNHVIPEESCKNDDNIIQKIIDRNGDIAPETINSSEATECNKEKSTPAVCAETNNITDRTLEATVIPEADKKLNLEVISPSQQDVKELQKSETTAKSTCEILHVREPSFLVKTIAEGKIEEVINRIMAGDNIEEEDEDGLNPFLQACSMGRLDIMQRLIDAGCDKSATNSDRISSLHVAVRTGKVDVVTFLLSEGVIPDVREKVWGRTPIHEATISAQPRVLKVIITKLQEDPWESRRILKIPDKDGQTALHLAASEGMTEIINLLLSGGATVDVQNNEGTTPLHVSLLSHRGKKRCGGVLTQLLEAGGDVEIEGGTNHERISHFAARVGCRICLAFLDSRGADLMAKDKLGRSPLHVTAWEGEIDAAKFLIAKKVNLDCVDEKGRRPLHLAILGDNPAIIEILLEAGADPTATDSDGRTYIQLAILGRKLNAFKALVRLKAISLPEESGEDVIHFSAALGYSNAILYLLENGWDINMKDSKGRTALHRSLNHGYEELAMMLINAGASLQEVDDAGATPLHYAVRWGGSDAILRMFVKKKAKLGVTDRLGRTPLHYAASKFSIMSDLYILLGGGSALDSKDQMGLTPLHLAARLGNESLVRILLEKGAKHNIADIDNFLPIDHAIEKDHKSIVKRLADHDLKVNPRKRESGPSNPVGCSTSTATVGVRDPRAVQQQRKSVLW